MIARSHHITDTTSPEIQTSLTAKRVENTNTVPPVVDLKFWTEQLPELSETYQAAGPFPHIQLDDFLDSETALYAAESFPDVEDAGWIHYVHLNEKKHGLNKRDLLPESLSLLIDELNSPEFCAFLSKLTGIPNLLPDDSMEGGGLHQSKRNGFLNVHADFTVHPHQPHWRRRVNLLIYLNPDWKPEYRGELELWERDMSRCSRRILPLLNRAVIFNTDEDSYHGLPDPIQCPEGMTRKSIALYYFTEEKELPKKVWTNYRSRPTDGLKAALFWLDKRVLWAYSTIKSKLGIDDSFVSKTLGWLSRKKS
ncbi:MAG TPA: 2OG-Fe(II) oxygenase [Planctomicrobium sp.]|nr:2OG-Fe(II) oxygenase [Planctomicrobium sp.]